MHEMNKRINERFIRDLYELSKNKRSAVNAVLADLAEIKNPYLSFLLYAAFHKVCDKLYCPRPFNLLLGSRKVVVYLLQKLLGRDIIYEADEASGVKNKFGEMPRKRIKASAEYGQDYKNRENNEFYGDEDETAGSPNSESDYIEVMEFLLNMERTNKRISHVDRPFIVFLLSKIPEAKKLGLIRFSGVTPLSILVMKAINPDNLSVAQLGVINFLKAKDMSYEDGLIYSHRSGVPFKALRRSFLRSGFSEIQEYFHTLIDFYPEMMFGAKKPYEDRLEIFGNPLSIPSNVKLLHTYIPASIYFIKHKLGSSGPAQNLEVLIKTIYIERILSKHPKKPFLKKVVHQMILETPILIRIVVMRGFKQTLIDKIIRYVPSFHLAYDLSLRMLCKDPKNQFYSALTEKLLKKYPIESNIEKFRACIHLFHESFLSRFDYLLK